MTGPSVHLSWAELACKDGNPYPEKWRHDRAIALARAFEYIRVRAGEQPIQILSAFRTYAWNKRVGGARHSQHVEGRALDLRPPKGWTVDRFFYLMKEVAVESRLQAWPDPVGGIGRYPSFVHVDIRPGKLVVWDGSRPQADQPGPVLDS